MENGKLFRTTLSVNLQDLADTFLTRRNKPIFLRILVKFDGF